MRFPSNIPSFLLTGLALAFAGAVAAQEAPPAAEPPGATQPALEDYRNPVAMSTEAREDAALRDRRGEQLPLDAVFDTISGDKVQLGDLLRPGRPALLQFVYFRCPSMCGEVLKGTLELLRAMRWTPGDEFDLITISINPQETSNLARLKHGAYIEALGRPEAAKGWHFLSGSEHQIRQVADAAGFGFRFVPEIEEFSHSAALYVITPEGVVSRAVYGLRYDPQTVRYSLIEAADGRVGSALDRILLYCYHYDPDTGVYSAHVMNIMRVVGLACTLVMGGLIATALRRERLAAAAAPSPSLTTNTSTGGTAS